MNFVDPEGLLFGALINAGEEYGESAAFYWATLSINPNNAWYETAAYDLMGLFASLWTPCTSDKTLATLAGGYLARVFGPFTTRGLPRYLQNLRRFIRFDRPHHGQGWHFDGDLLKFFKK